MGIVVTHTVQASISSQATLSDLEQLVAAAKNAGLNSGSRINVQHYAGDQREPSYTTITVSAR